MSDNDQAHLESLRRLYKRRLQLLETQAAQFGIYAPTHIQIEIEDTKAKIAEINAQLGQTEVTAPPTSITPQTKLAESQLNELVRLLLSTPSVANRELRETIVQGLPSQISNSIVRSSQTRLDVTNMVRATLNYPDGLDALMTQVRYFEGDSYPMRAIDEFLHSARVST